MSRIFKDAIILKKKIKVIMKLTEVMAEIGDLMINQNHKDERKCNDENKHQNGNENDDNKKTIEGYSYFQEQGDKNTHEVEDKNDKDNGEVINIGEQDENYYDVNKHNDRDNEYKDQNKDEVEVIVSKYKMKIIMKLPKAMLMTTKN